SPAASSTSLAVIPVPAIAESAAKGFTLHLPRSSWLFVLLAIGVAVLVVRIARLVRGLMHWRKLRASSPELPAALNTFIGELPPRYFRRRPGVRLSGDVTGPVTMGFRHPTILLPRSFPRDLSSTEIRQIVHHELAHVTRYDDWTNLLQRVTEALFF